MHTVTNLTCNTHTSKCARTLIIIIKIFETKRCEHAHLSLHPSFTVIFVCLWPHCTVNSDFCSFSFYPQPEEFSKLGLIISIHRWRKSGKFHQLQQNHIVRIVLSGITKMNKFAHFLRARLDFTVFLKSYYVLHWQWIKILGESIFYLKQ